MNVDFLEWLTEKELEQAKQELTKYQKSIAEIHGFEQYDLELQAILEEMNDF